jgi:hypothetical protein
MQRKINTPSDPRQRWAYTLESPPAEALVSNHDHGRSSGTCGLNCYIHTKPLQGQMDTSGLWGYPTEQPPWRDPFGRIHGTEYASTYSVSPGAVPVESDCHSYTHYPTLAPSAPYVATTASTTFGAFANTGNPQPQGAGLYQPSTQQPYGSGYAQSTYTQPEGYLYNIPQQSTAGLPSGPMPVGAHFSTTPSAVDVCHTHTNPLSNPLAPYNPAYVPPHGVP